ncbi:MAG TPA: dihydrolipoyl dehydrogenase [Thermodesulfovibrionales bacterium]|nr:dihydrolipoyl dehydrogenase [Thermodesulfovibrionales bacterium]
MKTYDIIVVGAGDVGLGITFKALAAGFRVALIEKGNVGGTCINVGCVPSKTLIYPADRIMEIREAAKLGIHAEITRIDFGMIMQRMKDAVTGGRNSIRDALKDSESLDFYNEEGRFIKDYTLELKSGKIKGRKIFIASGARPMIPQIKGIDAIDYLTNEGVLELERRPESVCIIGGGYIGVEYGHFFAAMGTDVTIVQMNRLLIPHEEPEISELLQKEMSRRMRVLTGTEVAEVRHDSGGYAVLLRDGKTGGEKEIKAEKIMVATGRRPNADLLKVENTGVETDETGFIKVDDYLRTSKKNIWALGDAIGKQMFTHAGDKEAELAWHNANSKKKVRMDFLAVPHAVFTRPEIASVGLTEEQARKDHDVMVGKAKYSDTVKGSAMGEEESFAKAIVEKKSGRILGFHIIGPDASILIQEIVNAVATGRDMKSVTESMHIFPALSDLITETLNNLE